MMAFVIPLVDFDVPTNVVILGLITGLTYSLLGIGITLVYRSSRVINFAHGEMGALPAVLIPIFVLNLGWNYWPSLGVAIVASLTLGALFEFLVIRRLRAASRLTVLVATIGAAQLLFIGGALLPKGGDLAGRSYPTPFSGRVTIGDLILGPGQLTILVAVPVITLALALFLGRSKLGKASRAAAENADAARLAGVPIHRVSITVWAIAGLLAGVSAILIGPTRPLTLSVALGPQLMLRALTAAMLGGLTGFFSVFFAGIAIGIVEALVLWNYPIGGVLDLILFVIIAVSFFAKKGLGSLARGNEESSWSLAASIRPLHPSIAADTRVKLARLLTLAVVAAAAIYLPTHLSASEQFFLSGVVLFATMGLSLVVLTGFAGQVSLGQFAFVAVGAAFGGRFYQLGIPHGPGIILATLVGGAMALLIGLPALRIRGLFLAVTTLGFSVATSGWLLQQDWLAHRSDIGVSSLSMPRPELFGMTFDHELRYYWLCLAALALVAAVVQRVRTSGLGRRMVAVRDNEPSAASLAVSPRTTKLMAFVLSGMIASFAGFLYGGLLVSFSSDVGGTFGPSESLALVVMTVFGGVTTITGAILGALWVEGIPRLLGEDWGILSSGIGVLAVLLVLPGGLASLVFTVRDRLVDAAVDKGWIRPRVVATEASGGDSPDGDVTVAPVVAAAVERERTRDPERHPLEASGITVSYGGVLAVTDVSMHAAAGEIVGVMGPNGAGKTTLFDALSGHLTPDGGSVYLDGRNITGLAPYRRARLGLGRSFQQARLFEDMNLVDAVDVALERDQPSPVLRTLIGSPGARRRDRERHDTAAEVLASVGLADDAHRQISTLSTGTRRLAELACATALGAHVILLDEPTAGLTGQEVDAFTQIIGELRERTNITVVIIDHDVPMMRSVVDRLYVLEAGALIASGPPSLLDTDERVIQAYMGSEQAMALSKHGTTIHQPGGI